MSRLKRDRGFDRGLLLSDRRLHWRFSYRRVIRGLPIEGERERTRIRDELWIKTEREENRREVKRELLFDLGKSLTTVSSTEQTLSTVGRRVWSSKHKRLECAEQCSLGNPTLASVHSGHRTSNSVSTQMPLETV